MRTIPKSIRPIKNGTNVIYPGSESSLRYVMSRLKGHAGHNLSFLKHNRSKQIINEKLGFPIGFYESHMANVEHNVTFL